MEETRHDAYKFSQAAVIVFGILGNILVIISILRQKNVLKNNYYFLVLHLAICDLGAMIIYLLNDTKFKLLEQPFSDFTKLYYLGYNVSYFFQVSGIGIMLMISVLRYRAAVHPLKPALSRRKLKLVCGFLYIVVFIAGYLPAMPLCFMENRDNRQSAYNRNVAYFNHFLGYIIFCFYFCPAIFMAVVYFKIGRTLMNQHKHIKSICSNPAMRRSAPSSSFNILTFFRNRKTFFVCLFTVLCYAVGNIPMTVWIILWIREEHSLLTKYPWINYCANILRVTGSHSANPLIYGILDEKLLKFWKRRSTRKRRSPEQ